MEMKVSEFMSPPQRTKSARVFSSYRWARREHAKKVYRLIKRKRDQ